MAKRKSELEEDLASAEEVIESAAASIESGDIQSAKASLDEYLSEEDEEGPTPDDE